MNITDLKTAVTQLSQDELAEFVEWLNKFQESQWDKQIEEDKTKEEIIADFRQAWYEAMTGQTIPIAQVWEGVFNHSSLAD
ncbi:hypothetical protein [Aerosakkonema funiforme]|uniref:Uncharacterized protein n=1 Tax=Aerosakkonema funiforme FACHB-1375 TaxID=2949571 RepID=A0A926VHB6_9CYAN|nr:hypothetical protein [Aerosakkonema funiforme]MBD2183138.1 hypothetical protein [Aerosakkonema funiforme FACHB-1375]